jgi:hypothetical protein
VHAAQLLAKRTLAALASCVRKPTVIAAIKFAFLANKPTPLAVATPPASLHHLSLAPTLPLCTRSDAKLAILTGRIATMMIHGTLALKMAASHFYLFIDLFINSYSSSYYYYYSDYYYFNSFK